MRGSTAGRPAPAQELVLVAAIAGFCHLIVGFDNRALAQRMRVLLDPGYSAQHATQDPRPLRRKQAICRIPGSRRYQLTGSGRAVAVLFTKAYGRIPGPGLALLDPPLPDDLAMPSPWRSLTRELDRFVGDGLAPG